MARFPYKACTTYRHTDFIGEYRKLLYDCEPSVLPETTPSLDTHQDIDSCILKNDKHLKSETMQLEIAKGLNMAKCDCSPNHDLKGDDIDVKNERNSSGHYTAQLKQCEGELSSVTPIDSEIESDRKSVNCKAGDKLYARHCRCNSVSNACVSANEEVLHSKYRYSNTSHLCKLGLTFDSFDSDQTFEEYLSSLCKLDSDDIDLDSMQQTTTEASNVDNSGFNIVNVDNSGFNEHLCNGLEKRNSEDYISDSEIDNNTIEDDFYNLSFLNDSHRIEFTYDHFLECNQFLLHLGIAEKMNGEAPSPPPAAEGGATETNSDTGARKQLPAVPMQGTSAANADKTSPRGTNYGPFFMEYSLLAEYNQIQKQKLPGVYVIPSAQSPLLWFGVLFIRQGLYQSGVFKFNLYIPENYPDTECPRVVFETPVFHPVIHPVTGELDVKRGFQKWRRNVNHLWQVLLYARRVFYKIDTKQPLNPEAAVLYEKNLELYKSRIQESIKQCKAELYAPPKTDDPHAICFSEWEEGVHEAARRSMLEAKSPLDDGVMAGQVGGLTWMKKGSNQIFSRDDCPSL